MENAVNFLNIFGLAVILNRDLLRSMIPYVMCEQASYLQSSHSMFSKREHKIKYTQMKSKQWVPVLSTYCPTFKNQRQTDKGRVFAA